MLPDGLQRRVLLAKLGAIKLTVLITIWHLVIIIASDFIAVRVASTSLGKSLGDPIVPALKLQLALDHLKRCVVRLVICRRLLLLKYKLCAGLLGHVHLKTYFGRPNRLEGSACRHTGRGRASLAPACISAMLGIIVKYVFNTVIYGYLVIVIYLMKFRAYTVIDDFARITLTEHCDIFFVSKALDVRSRNSLGDCPVP